MGGEAVERKDIHREAACEKSVSGELHFSLLLQLEVFDGAGVRMETVASLTTFTHLTVFLFL